MKAGDVGLKVASTNISKKVCESKRNENFGFFEDVYLVGRSFVGDSLVSTFLGKVTPTVPAASTIITLINK